METVTIPEPLPPAPPAEVRTPPPVDPSVAQLPPEEPIAPADEGKGTVVDVLA